MNMNKLRENPTEVLRLNKSDYLELIEELEVTDKWFQADISSLKVEYVEAGTSADYTLLDAEKWQIENAFSRGTFVLHVDTDKFLLSKSSFFTFYDRLKIKCKLINDLEKSENNAGIAALLNTAISLSKGALTLLCRKGWIIAAHSSKYKPITQHSVYEVFNEVMQDKFKSKYEFVNATYSDLFTVAIFKLDAETIKEKYEEAWMLSGLHPDDLKASLPLVSLIASDTARYSIQVRPYFKVQFGSISTILPLSEPSKSTHHNTSSISSIKESIESVYAAVQEGAEFINDLLKQRVDYPVQCFVHAIKSAKLDKTSVLPFIALQEAFEDEILFTSKVSPLNPTPKKYTAFDVYLKICEVTKTPEYEAMLSSSKLILQEKLYQIKTLVNWRKVDFNDGATLKRKEVKGYE